MEPADCERMMMVVDSCLSRIKWRLQYKSKRRLLTDILCLCTGLRPVVLVDYGGLMPKLEEDLCSLLHLAQEESAILQPLRVMVLEDMAYIVHVKEFAEHISSSLTSQQQLVLLDLEQGPPEILLHAVENENASELHAVQKSFSSVFPVEVDASVLLPIVPHPMVKPVIGSSKCGAVDMACSSKHTAFQTSSALDLSYIMEDAKITLSSVNGWLLGYPITYLFSKEHAEKAMRNLSFNSLYHYKLFASRKGTLSSKLQEAEVLSFTVPCDVARGREEPWIEAFLARMEGKLKRCGQVWVSTRLEVNFIESNSQVIVV